MRRRGVAASGALAERLEGEPVTREERERDRYGRIVAVCYVGGVKIPGQATPNVRFRTIYFRCTPESRRTWRPG